MFLFQMVSQSLLGLESARTYAALEHVLLFVLLLKMRLQKQKTK